jgi:uncharacterized protein (DUF2147 family)
MKKLIFTLFSACAFLLSCIDANAQESDQICGKWMSAQKNLLVQVYRENNDYKAKILWFKADDESKPMDEWTDKHNPDPSLRNRKILGMNVVKNLRYNAKSKLWEDGDIYDSQSGRTWDASAAMTKDGSLKVIGFWHFKFIGRTMTFNRAVDYQAMSTH